MRSIIAASICLVALAGPARAQEEECPIAFIGAKVAAAKTRDGVSLEFKNPNRAHVQHMREQLREVADLIEEHGTQQQTTGAEDEEVEFPPVDVSVKDIGTGARVTVRAARFRDIPAIQELAFGFAEFWKTSACNAPLVSAK